MCEPCTTATECRPTRRRHPRPTRLEELQRIGTAALQAVGTFDFVMTDFDWGVASDGTPEAEKMVAEFQAAGHLIAGAVNILAKRYRKDFWDDHLAPHSSGSYLRHAARLMDELDLDTDMVDVMRDDADFVYHVYELCPHLLAERSSRNPAVCPLCGSKRRMHIICAEDDDGGDVQGWLCNTCEGDVKKAKEVLKAKRVDPDVKKRKAKTKTGKPTTATTPVPTSAFSLPVPGDAGKAAAKSRATPKARPPRQEPATTSATAPTLVNRVAALGG